MEIEYHLLWKVCCIIATTSVVEGVKDVKLAAETLSDEVRIGEHREENCEKGRNDYARNRGAEPCESGRDEGSVMIES